MTLNFNIIYPDIYQTKSELNLADLFELKITRNYSKLYDTINVKLINFIRVDFSDFVDLADHDHIATTHAKQTKQHHRVSDNEEYVYKCLQLSGHLGPKI